jgi:transposase
MEELLDLYERPYENTRPLVCFDEKSVELHAHLRSPFPLRPAKPKRRDYEYLRNGTRNVFLFVEPKAGKRHTLVTLRRTKADWAKAMRYLVDELYPDAPTIDLVLDNLNTHHYHSLVEFFGKQEADRIWNRLDIHYTPEHASWLNMAEIELSILSKQCLSRRIPDEWTLITEIVAWEQARNANESKIDWQFTTADARIKLKRLYPSIHD